MLVPRQDNEDLEAQLVLDNIVHKLAVLTGVRVINSVARTYDVFATLTQTAL